MLPRVHHCHQVSNVHIPAESYMGNLNMALLDCWVLEFPAKCLHFPCFVLSLAMAPWTKSNWSWTFGRARTAMWQHQPGCGWSSRRAQEVCGGWRGQLSPLQEWQQRGGEETSCSGGWQCREKRNWISSPPKKSLSAVGDKVLPGHWLFKIFRALLYVMEIVAVKKEKNPLQDCFCNQKCI